ncbi:MAG: site-specific DNA-methyltransferase [Mariprofundaceae bacterium]|nr:site-specific DNA-methyltransferase [Mariprofundaceae bacterium]
MKKTKLELTWIGKDKRPKLEPRILLEDPSKSYHAKHKVTDNDFFDNKLIFGDNLLALKALEQEYVGKVKCVYIDPPYNTGSAFEHYDDGLEHSIWLGMMKERLAILHNLLDADGSIWISIDDNECHYLKLVCDEIFGRNNFMTSIIWQQRTTRENRRAFSVNHEYVLLYAKDAHKFSKIRNDLGITEELKSRYKNPDNDIRGAWQSVSANAQAGHATPSQFYTFKAPNGKKHDPPKGRCWLYTEVKMKEEVAKNNIWFGRDGNGVPRIKKFLQNVKVGLTPHTLWTADEVGTNDHAKKNLLSMLNNETVFDTPKPESLIERILTISSNQGDLVLDSFAGSGTTAATAHKMNRRWITIELEESCHTHIIPRLQKVIDGDDQGGISKAVNWKGGGGFRYYSLAPSLIEYDHFGQVIINKAYQPEMLAEAICKLEGFTYSPSKTEWWNHGYSTESDFLYVTTQNLSVEKLEQISEEVGNDRTLLVCCGAFRCKADRFDNLTIKKIPKMVLSRCEWAHDDYSLNVENLPMAQKDAEQVDLFDDIEGGKR